MYSSGRGFIQAVATQDAGTYTCAVSGNNFAGSGTSTSAVHSVTAPTPTSPTNTTPADTTSTETNSGNTVTTVTTTPPPLTQPLTAPTIAIKQISKDRCVLDTPKRKKFYVPYTLNEPAQVKAILLHKSRSIANMGKCRAGKIVEENTKYEVVRTVEISGHSGTNLLPIDIISNDKRLRPGRYRIRLQGTNSEGATSTIEAKNFLLVRTK